MLAWSPPGTGESSGRAAASVMGPIAAPDSLRDAWRLAAHPAKRTLRPLARDIRQCAEANNTPCPPDRARAGGEVALGGDPERLRAFAQPDGGESYVGGTTSDEWVGDPRLAPIDDPATLYAEALRNAYPGPQVAVVRSSHIDAAMS